MLAPRRVAAWLFLALLTHAALVNAFHYHNIVLSETDGPARIAPHNGNNCPVHAPESASDSQCPSCHLQRSFISEFRAAAIPLDEAAQRQCSAPAATVFISRGPARVLADRAPPLV